MPFDYRAIDQTGRSVKGTLSAVNDVDLELRLKRMGLDLVTLAELSRQYAPQGRERVTRRDLVTFCIHMRYITRAGIPLLDGLRDLRDSMKRGFAMCRPRCWKIWRAAAVAALRRTQPCSASVRPQRAGGRADRPAGRGIRAPGRIA
jgi:hypothetical protein